jgi:agmatine deiminase
MITRRSLLLGAAAGTKSQWRMPDEPARHKRTWMAFGAHQNIWGARLIDEVQQNLALIAKTIAKYEPVTMLVEPSLTVPARRLLGDSVQLLVAPLDDLWARDTAPLFVLGPANAKAAVDLNFSGWGDKQTHYRDAEVARFIARKAGAQLLQTDLVLEGGCIEVDGHGTAIIAESCVLNNNRNPDISKDDFEQAISPLLGLEKIIWLPGVKGQDITDGHTDFYARFAAPGVVLAGDDPRDPITKQHLKILKAAKLEVIPLVAPAKPRNKFQSKDLAAGYVGFYVCNGAVIAQEFGDPKADKAALVTLEKTFPGRQVLQLNCDALAAGGGTIHCATQQEPA